MTRKWRQTVPLLGLLTLFLLGNKGCEKAAYVEHPQVPAGTECSTCHDDGRTRDTRPAGHDLAWSQNHGQFVQRFGFRNKTEVCLVCHTEAQCTKCHQQEMPRSHNQYWRLKGHGLMVGLDRSACFTCHRSDFCQRCHSQMQPTNHTAAWGTPSNLHCLSCHYPINSPGAQMCSVCHTSTPSHSAAPPQPNNALHAPGARCSTCHTPLRHPNNGQRCSLCHPRQ